jgi:hypothetical protein
MIFDPPLWGLKNQPDPGPMAAHSYGNRPLLNQLTHLHADLQAASDYDEIALVPLTANLFHPPIPCPHPTPADITNARVTTNHEGHKGLSLHYVQRRL